MSEKIVKNGSINLWTETFGNPSGPLLVLIPGTAGQGIMWRTEFCQALANNKLYVLRFDPRDTGLSTHLDFNTSPYSMKDMAEDIIAILKDYKAEKAHIVGLSMGGYIGQILAIDYPQYVNSLILIKTTTNFSPLIYSMMGMNMPFETLPGSDFQAINTLKEIGYIDPNNFSEWMEKSLKLIQVFNGSKTPFKEDEWKELLKDVYSRINKDNPAGVIHNHIMASGLGPTQFDGHKITCSTLIIHGGADPIIPIEHAHATYKTIPNSELFIIKDMGHVITQNYEDSIINVITKFI